MERIPPRSTINPAWTGDHSAALDGEQNKVLVSWSMMGDQVEFQVWCLESHLPNLAPLPKKVIRNINLDSHLQT